MSITRRGAFALPKGVKFDSKGQNVLGYALMIQLRGDQYVPVWPLAQATGKLELPFKGWA